MRAGSSVKFYFGKSRNWSSKVFTKRPTVSFNELTRTPIQIDLDKTRDEVLEQNFFFSGYPEVAVKNERK